MILHRRHHFPCSVRRWWRIRRMHCHLSRCRRHRTVYSIQVRWHRLRLLHTTRLFHSYKRFEYPHRHRRLSSWSRSALLHLHRHRHLLHTEKHSEHLGRRPRIRGRRNQTTAASPNLRSYSTACHRPRFRPKRMVGYYNYYMLILDPCPNLRPDPQVH